MLYFSLIVLSTVLLLWAKFFLLLAPLKYISLKEGKNVVYSTKLNKLYIVYFIVTVLIDITLISLSPKFFGSLFLDIILIVIIFVMIIKQKKQEKPFRVLLPLYKNDDVEEKFFEFTSGDPNVDYTMSANKSPLFITSHHENEEEFAAFVDRLNNVDGLFIDLSTKKMRNLYKMYPVLIMISIIYIIRFVSIQTIIYNLFA